MAKEINATLRQTSVFGHITEFQIIEGRELHIFSGGKSPQPINLLALSEQSRLRIHIPWLWLSLALLFSVLLLVYLSLRGSLGADIRAFEFLIVVVSVLGLIGSLAFFILKVSRKRIFYSYSAHVPLFEIIVSKPNSREYKAFLDNIGEYIKQARESWNLSDEQQMAGELKTIRRMANAGMISQDDYEQAKSKLFAMNNNSQTHSLT